MTLTRTDLPSALGPLLLVENDGALCALGWNEAALTEWLARRFGATPLRAGRAASANAVAAYLDGDLAALDSLAVDPGGTDFQRRVWSALREIPVGATASYAEIARAVGRPEAVRAVGAANGKNPISLVIPCHRVIRSDGDLCGYAGGVERKRWLLRHERAIS